MEEIRKGDMFYIRSSFQEEGNEQHAGRPAIVVSNNKNNQCSNVVEIVYLTTKQKNDLPTHIDIRSCERPSIALCEQISSVSKARLGDYIGSLTETELNLLDAAMMISLDIGQPVHAELVPIPKPVLKEEKKDEHTQAIAVERDIYKKMYEELIEKIIRGGAA